MNATEYRQAAAKAMKEKELQATVEALARRLHWLAYHSWTSVHSAPGFPDLVLVSAQQNRFMLRELKREGTKPTPQQEVWLTALTAVGVDVAVWRPSQLLDGSIEADLRGHPGAQQ